MHRYVILQYINVYFQMQFTYFSNKEEKMTMFTFDLVFKILNLKAVQSQ